MKKIVLTEKQTENLIGSIVEQTRSMYDLIHKDPDIHSIEVRECDFNHRGLKYKGQEVEDVILGWKFRIEYRIDLEWREYGIKGISVYGFRGPKEIDVTIVYYNGQYSIEDNYTPEEEHLKLPVNWDAVEAHQDETIGFFGVDDEVQIDLMNDQQGNIVVGTIHLNTNSF